MWQMHDEPFFGNYDETYERERERERERGCKKLYYENNQQKLQKITVHKVILIHSKIE